FFLPFPHPTTDPPWNGPACPQQRIYRRHTQSYPYKYGKITIHPTVLTMPFPPPHPTFSFFIFFILCRVCVCIKFIVYWVYVCTQDGIDFHGWSPAGAACIIRCLLEDMMEG
ncbi:unnamed protein product, partial [Choristocarpus tenellus]